MTETLIIVLAFNEVDSLEKTVNKLIEEFKPKSPKIVVSTTLKASSECLGMANALAVLHENVEVYFQREPFVAAAVMEVVRTIPSDYVIYMSADGETPAEYAPRLIQELISTGVDIVSASRWLPGGSLTDYGFLKTLVSKLAQLTCKVIYSSSLTEFTYGYRAYRYNAISCIDFKERKHPFFLESLLIPIRLGVKIREIPVAWVSRDEGSSVIDFGTLMSYLRPIYQVRFRNKKDLALNDTKRDML